jgi:hypothetical protein
MADFPHLNIQTETVTFEKLPIGFDARVPRRVLQDLTAVHRDHGLRQATIHQQLSPIYDELFISLRSYLLKSLHQERKIAGQEDVPTTAWDHVKHEMLKSTRPWVVWLAKKFTPPKYSTIVTEVVFETRVCPHNDSYLSDSQQHFRWMLWRDDNRLGFPPNE